MPKGRYNREFKVSAIKLVRERSGDVLEAARNLGIDARTLSGWIKKFAGQGDLALTREEEMAAELQRLRKENARLQMERDILKKAAAFFAKEQP